ncbi:hypothetical protein ABZ023_18405 [Streptomyces sp. NPDC006367]|uniref:hypothetical protein n=1 Tax=unclassified Streptomyces TaxID=2593676 RepID=UPI0033BD1386
MSDQPIVPPPSDAGLPPLTPDEMPPQLQTALKQMSRRGPVVDVMTGQTVADAGRLVGEQPHEVLVGCSGCARAVAQGWWGSIARHAGSSGAPVCVMCGEGEATLSAVEWFQLVAELAAARTAAGSRRSWREDAVKGLGVVTPMPCPTCVPEQPQG